MEIDANYLLLSMFVSSIGFVMFMYGKKQKRPLQLAGGVALFLFPYFVHNLLVITVIAVLICVLVTVGVKMGL